jgi:SAM-dependent methyltransferase
MKYFKAYWEDHWRQAESGEHRYTTEEWLRFYANEILLYCPAQPVRALELGCGSGQLYGYLKPRFASYIGVDFSEKLMEKFRAQWNDVHLLRGDMTQLPLKDVKFDFIFSNAVWQYLDRDMIRSNLEQVYPLLEDNGVYFIGHIPDAQLKLLYYAQALRPDLRFSWMKLFSYFILCLLGRPDSIGKWYTRQFICTMAHELGYHCTTYSDASYEYRFNAVLRKH